jgi:hypothetical protein
MGDIVTPLYLVIILLLVVVPPFWQIFKKAGFAPALSLLMCVPILCIVVLWVIAFVRWKPARA